MSWRFSFGRGAWSQVKRAWTAVPPGGKRASGAAVVSGVLFTGAGWTWASAEAATASWRQDWDGRAGQAPSAAPDKDVRRHILLIRHGQYVYAKEDIDRVLTELGRHQAVLTGKRLKDLHVPIPRVITSTMTRACETSEIIVRELGGKVPIEKFDIFREGRPCVPEPLGSRHVASYQRDVAKEGPRIDKAFESVFYRPPPSQTQDTWEVVVGHANVVRYFTMRALQLPPEAWLRLSLANCGIIWLTIRHNGHVSLKAFGDHGHIPFEKVTFA